MVTQFIEGFYDRLLQDKEVAPLLLRSQQAQSVDVYIALLKERTVDYLEAIWGGDEWSGQDLFRAHAHLHISAKAYDKSMKHAAAQLKTMKLAPDVAKDILQECEIMGEPITDADGKFHKWVEDKQREIEAKSLADGAVDLHGMGFTSSPQTIKDMQDKQNRRDAIKAKLANMKAERIAQEKQQQKDAKKKEKQRQVSGDSAKADAAKPVNAGGNAKPKAQASVKGKAKAPKKGEQEQKNDVPDEQKIGLPCEEKAIELPPMPEEEEGISVPPESVATSLLLGNRRNSKSQPSIPELFP